jgi:hypothetical protein
VSFGLPYPRATFGIHPAGVSYEKHVIYGEDSDDLHSLCRPWHYYSVAFGEVRKGICYSDHALGDLEPDDYVVIQMTHGFDLGRIVSLLVEATSSIRANAKRILRKATQNEVTQLSVKAEREVKALRIAMEKVAENGYEIEIDRAESRFDGKKWTFYYHTYGEGYLDSRALVGTLFQIFGIRVAMLKCPDGCTSPDGNSGEPFAALWAST